MEYELWQRPPPSSESEKAPKPPKKGWIVMRVDGKPTIEPLPIRAGSSSDRQIRNNTAKAAIMPPQSADAAAKGQQKPPPLDWLPSLWEPWYSERWDCTCYVNALDGI